MIKEKVFLGVLLWLVFLVFPFPSHPDSRVEIHTLRHHVHPSFTRVVVEIGKVREFNYNELKSPDRVYVDIYQATESHPAQPCIPNKKRLPQPDSHRAKSSLHRARGGGPGFQQSLLSHLASS